MGFTLWDILSIRTALNVSKGIKFEFATYIKTATLIITITTILIVILNRKPKKIKIKKRLISFCISIVILTILLSTSYIRKIPIWNINYAYSDYGVILTISKLLATMKVKKPENYKKQEVEQILNNYDNSEANAEPYNSDVNIIAIMNESFTDYTKNDKINMITDNLPFFHSLQQEENTISGIMHSDQFGGGTANIEYEFLTQNTIAFLPVGSIVYQQYIKENIDSIVTRMKQLNYTTYGTHLWFKNGYKRNIIYRLLQFDHYCFIEDCDYLALEYLPNEYTLDRSSYKKIIETLENKTDDEKIFYFNLTVQNHVPFESYSSNETDYINDTITQLNIFLQTEKKSDDALETLINYLRNYEEKIILIFFGDHQPETNTEIINEDEENKYKVPYLIWANYDIEEKEYGDTSANYLQSILIETAGLPKDAYTNYITELREKIPIITANYYIGNDGEKYMLNDKTSPYYEDIKEYEKIVYYNIFDK